MKGSTGSSMNGSHIYTKHKNIAKKCDCSKCIHHKKTSLSNPFQCRIFYELPKDNRCVRYVKRKIVGENQPVKQAENYKSNTSKPHKNKKFFFKTADRYNVKDFRDK